MKLTRVTSIFRSPPMSFFPLPQELIDHTIDHLHNDKLSLAACSLVCKNWLSSARRHVFNKLILDTSINIVTHLMFLQSHASIALYVRSLILRNSLGIDFPGTHENIIAHFPRLKALHLMKIVWKPLSHSYSVSAELSELTLTNCYFDGPVCFADCIRTFPHLKSIVIVSMQPLQPFRPSSTTNQYGSLLLPALPPLQDHPLVRITILSPSSENMNTTAEFLHFVGENIEELLLRYNAEGKYLCLP